MTTTWLALHTAISHEERDDPSVIRAKQKCLRCVPASKAARTATWHEAPPPPKVPRPNTSTPMYTSLLRAPAAIAVFRGVSSWGPRAFAGQQFPWKSTRRSSWMHVSSMLERDDSFLIPSWYKYSESG